MTKLILLTAATMFLATAPLTVAGYERPERTSANLTFVSSPDTDGLSVSASEYGANWPYLGFSGGTLHCRPVQNPISGEYDLQEITITLGGEIYGLNGPALDRLPDARQFVPRDEFDAFETKALQVARELMEKGRSLC